MNASQIFAAVITWLRFGRLRTETKSVDGGCVSEYIVYSCRTGKVVGYFAYGHFEPRMPYKGQPAFWSM